MKIATTLLLTLLTGLIDLYTGLVVSTIARPVSVKFGKSMQLRRSTARQLIDPVVMDTMQTTADVATNTFFTSILARTIGTVVGNLLAAFAFKYATDLFFQKRDEEKAAVAAAAPPSAAPVISQSAWIKLLFCIMIDLGSDASFLLPGIGELEDVAWAPISAYLLNLIFGSSVVSTLEFAKEILPGTDILPVATFAWVLQNIFVDSPITGVLGLGRKPEEIIQSVQVEKKESVSPEMDAWDNKMKNKL